MSSEEKVAGLHAPEGAPALYGGGSGNGGSKYGKRLANIEAEMKSVAKTVDIANMESRLLKWQVGIPITAVLVSGSGIASLIVNVMKP